jgi:FlaG/FlaF family flagellin (archaellin)
VIAVVLLVAIVVVLAASVSVYLLGFGGEVSEPPGAAVSVERTTFTTSSECNGGSDPEVALDVTLVAFQRADTIYVRADAGPKKVIWSDPGPADVGTTKRVANEATGNAAGVDVDIGGGGDVAICPGEDVTFRFYAEYDGQTLALQEIGLD